MDRARFGLCIAVWVTAGCSSASFDVITASGADAVTTDIATDDATGDTRAEDTFTEDALTVDSSTPPPIDATPPPDTAVLDVGPPSCATSGTAPTSVYVDAKSSHAMPNGSASCPFKTINAAVSYIATLPVAARTIYVRAGTYNETSAVVVRAQVTLNGAGAALTTIMGGGGCMGIGNCVVRVEGGGTLENVTVDGAPTAKHAIVTGATDPGGFPVLKNLKATGAIGDGNAGVLTSAGSQLGPNVDVSGNKLGLVVWGNQKTMISGGNNHFDRNVIGINHEGTGVLTFTGGGTVHNNTEVGIKLGDTSGSMLPLHDLQGFSVAENKVGIRILQYASAYVRRLSILNNKIGIIAIYGLNNAFDFGSGADNGKNVFGTMGMRNQIGAICAINTRTTPLKAVGNLFLACDATTKAVISASDTACDSLPTTSYTDLWYTGLSAPDGSSCSPG